MKEELEHLKKPFLDFIQEHRVKVGRCLLAVSGGIDSVVLVYLFAQSKLPFGIAHCNFGLRGEESNGDEAFVRELAKRSKVPFYCKKFDTAKIAHSQNISIQMAARELRYAWFEEIAEHEGYDTIATAHHAQDSTETILFNLTRGTGVSGLRGILPWQGLLVRPLLNYAKDQIHDIAALAQLGWREDSSNQSAKYARNKIRMEVLPVLKSINPSLDQSISLMSNRLIQLEELLVEASHRFENSFIKESNTSIIKIDKGLLLAQKTIVVYHCLRKYGFNWSQCTTLGTWNHETTSGKSIASDTYVISLDRNYFFLAPVRNLVSKPMLISSLKGKMEYLDNTWEWEEKEVAKGYIPDTNPQTVEIDAAKIRLPLICRPWKEGDAFVPLGMNGRKKKVSDFLINAKVPAVSKKHVCVVLQADAIVWLAGFRMDDRYKITAKTKRIFRIKLYPSGSIVAQNTSADE